MLPPISYRRVKAEQSSATSSSTARALTDTAYDGQECTHLTAADPYWDLRSQLQVEPGHEGSRGETRPDVNESGSF